MTEELFRDDAYRRGCSARVTVVNECGIELDRTVFYPLGGGQPGDSGVLRLPAGDTLRIVDTRKGNGTGDILHLLESPPHGGLLGKQVEALVDWERRHRLMRMHTLLHLLCVLIPAGVTGGSVRDGSGRLDFDLPDSVLEKNALTEQLNRLISEDHAVHSRWIDDAELAAHPELVRTMSVKPPSGQGRVRLIEIEGLDLQPCGGTHVASTGEIGPVVVRKIEKKGKHNRRVNVAFA